MELDDLTPLDLSEVQSFDNLEPEMNILLDYENKFGKVSMRKLLELIGQGGTKTFQIRKIKGSIVAISPIADNEASELKLTVFRRRKSTIRRFFAAGSVNDDGFFVDAVAAKTADFIFPIRKEDGRYGLVLQDDTVSEFQKILKADSGSYYIGQTAKRFANPSWNFGIGIPEGKSYYTLYVALTKNEQIVSNFVKIYAFYSTIAANNNVIGVNIK